MMLALASFTGWGLEEIRAMDADDFFDFVNLLPRNG
jgi:hypothetical protein